MYTVFIVLAKYFLFLTGFLNYVLFSLLHCKNIVYNTHARYVLIIYVMDKASGLQVVKFLGESKVMGGIFDCAESHPSPCCRSRVNYILHVRSIM